MLAVPNYTILGSAPCHRMQLDMESEIHNLEQIAYGAVLRAFMAQSDALTWEKEDIIAGLREELRISVDEHRQLLTDVKADDHIRKMREWREAGGNQNVAANVPHHFSSQIPSLSSKKRKTSLSDPFVTPSQPLHPQSDDITLSAVKWGPASAIGGRRPDSGQPAFAPAKPVHDQITDHVSSRAPVNDLSESILNSLVGRRVMHRWPEDNKFHEAVIAQYNPRDGHHMLIYDRKTPHEALKWVNIKKVPPEDIRWVDEDPVISQLNEAGLSNSGRDRPSSMNQVANEIQPSRNGDASHPNALELDRAKRTPKEHEQTLTEVIQKLAYACESGTEVEHEQTLTEVVRKLLVMQEHEQTLTEVMWRSRKPTTQHR